MTLVGLVDAINRAGIKLSVNVGKLRVDAPIGAMTDELRAGLAEHRETLLVAFAPSTPAALATRPVDPAEPEDVFIIDVEGQEILIDADMMGAATNVLRDWLWMMASRFECGTVYDRRGNPLHVVDTITHLMMGGSSRAWLEEAHAFYAAMRRARPNLPHVGEVAAYLASMELEPWDQERLDSILPEFNHAWDREDQEGVNQAWAKLNAFNSRLNRAKASPPPTLPKSVPTAGDVVETERASQTTMLPMETQTSFAWD